MIDSRQRDRNGRLGKQQVERTVSEIGKQANVRVSQPGQKAKSASAHDLRRSFGWRWAKRVMPAVLKELMRHETIQTTMLYYVGQNAEDIAATLWDAYEKAGDTLGATLPKAVEYA